MDKAKELIANILDEEKEYKLRELEIINEKLQQTEEQLDKMRLAQVVHVPPVRPDTAYMCCAHAQSACIVNTKHDA